MKADDQIEAIKQILAEGDENMVQVDAKLLFERMRASEKRIIALFEDSPLTLSDIKRLSDTNSPGSAIKKAFKGLEELGFIREVEAKGLAKPYELTERGKRFRDIVA